MRCSEKSRTNNLSETNLMLMEGKYRSSQVVSIIKVITQNLS